MIARYAPAAAVLALAAAAPAATINLDATSYSYTTIAAPTSGNVLRLTGSTPGLGAGASEGAITWQPNPISLPAGNYTVSFDVFVVDAFDRLAMELPTNAGPNDNSDFDNGPNWNTIGLNTWRRITGPLTIVESPAGDTTWSGKFETKSIVFGGTNDQPDSGNILFDNLFIRNASNQVVLGYTFDSDTPGLKPANVTTFGAFGSSGTGNGTNRAGTALVEAIPEPASAALLGLATLALLPHRRATR